MHFNRVRGNHGKYIPESGTLDQCEKCFRLCIWQNQLRVERNNLISLWLHPANAYFLLMKSPMGMFLVRQLSWLALFWDMGQDSGILAFCGSTAILESLVSSRSAWVGWRWVGHGKGSGEWKSTPSYGQAWKKASMAFIHIPRPEVSYEVPPGCKLSWEMYSSWCCQRK